MHALSFVRAARRIARHARQTCPGWPLAIAALTLAGPGGSVGAQGIDCGQLQAQMAQAGRGGNRYASAARKQAAELARTQAYAQRLGCSSGFMSIFGGGDPQCSGLNQRIGQMQANLNQLQAYSGGGARADLVQRYNAYCRGGQQPPHQRGFFESLFGITEEPRQPLPQLPVAREDNGDGHARGGSQAVCVKTCDGSFFPLGLSTRRKSASLNEMCSALCPGTETAVFTRSPDAEIKSAVSLDGKSYSELPNALRFQKDFTPACSCRSAGTSWAETLANAEEVLGNTRKTDIMVTQEKSDELSRPKAGAKIPTVSVPAGTTKVTPAEAGAIAGSGPAAETEEVTGPDGVKRLVRRVGPQP